MNRMSIEKIVLFVLVAIFASVMVVYLWSFISIYFSSVNNDNIDIESYIEKKVSYKIRILNTKYEDDNLYILFSDENESSANILMFKKWKFDRLVYKGGAFRLEKDGNINNNLFGVYSVKDDNEEKVLIFGINKGIDAKYMEMDINGEKVKRNVDELYFIISYKAQEKEKININNIKFFGKHDEDITEKFILKKEVKK